MSRPVVAAFFFLAAATLLHSAGASITDLDGHRQNPFQDSARIQVLLFVRTDCPVTNRYAPELQAIAARFVHQPVQIWLVYPDRTESVAHIRRQIEEYGFPGTALLDPRHELVARAEAVVAPEAAVFGSKGELLYHGRIDNRWVDLGRSRPAATVHDLADAIDAGLHGRTVRQPVTRAIGCSLADVE